MGVGAGHTFNLSVSLLVWLCVLLSRYGVSWAAGKGKCEVCKNFVKAFEEVSFIWNTNGLHYHFL